MKKITILGAGNAGCLTALHFGYYTADMQDVSIELIYDPSRPPEKVGQGTILDVPKLLYDALQINWYDNSIDATPKHGTLFEGWGKKNDKVINPIALMRTAIHISPNKLHKAILESGYFKVIESEVFDYDKIDSDYIIDCRGKPSSLDGYKTLVNPLNSAILAQTSETDLNQNWTRAVATPDGWTFSIRLKSLTSYGYLYNDKITSTESATANFEEQFKVKAGDKFRFNQYVAENPIIDNRIFLNGNKLFFLEPLEATAMGGYLYWARMVFSIIFEDLDQNERVNDFHNYVSKINRFISWHYTFGSKYDTPFWEEAQKSSIEFLKDDDEFNEMIELAKKHSYTYIIRNGEALADEGYFWAQWDARVFKKWYDGMTTLV